MASAGHILRQALLLPTFRSSKSYWERRYRLGGTSGEGSYGRLAAFKAEVINDLIRQEAIESVIELGCGDGNQLSLSNYPRYLGLDISESAIDFCRNRFDGDDTKAFLHYDPTHVPKLGDFLKCDLVLSLDVIYHLVEPEIYNNYLENLFAAARAYVLIYSSDEDQPSNSPHVLHRKFTRDVCERFQDFRLVKRIENRYPDESPCSFFLFQRLNSVAA